MAAVSDPMKNLEEEGSDERVRLAAHTGGAMSWAPSVYADPAAMQRPISHMDCQALVQQPKSSISQGSGQHRIDSHVFEGGKGAVSRPFTDDTLSISDWSKGSSQSAQEQPSSSQDVQGSEVCSGKQAVSGCPLCQVCGDVSAGYHCGAYVCEACKKFFLRCMKPGRVGKFNCRKKGDCQITRQTRTKCPYCRHKRCMQLGMYAPGQETAKGFTLNVVEIPCKVCGAPSSGYHFGSITCEGCKGFFRRIRQVGANKYVCTRGQSCFVNAGNRNICKYCRYQKCLQVGMNAEGIRIGRKPNAIKHATIVKLRQKTDQAKLEVQTNDPTVKNGPKTHTTHQRNLQDNSKSVCPAVTSNQVCFSATSVLHDLIKSDEDVKNEHKKEKCAQSNVRGGATRRHWHSRVMNSNAVTGKQNVQKSRSACSADSSDGSQPAAMYWVQIAAEQPEVIRKAYLDLCIALQKIRLPALVEADIECKDEDICFRKAWKIVNGSASHLTTASLKFAKKIPGFRQLDLAEQIALVRQSVYQLVLLLCSRSYDPETRKINFFGQSELEAKFVIKYIPEFSVCMKHHHLIGQIITPLLLTEMEHACLSAIILLTSEGGQVCNSSLVSTLQLNMVDSLRKYCEATSPDPNRFGVLLMRLAELRCCNMEHFMAAREVSRRKPDHEFGQLWMEMFVNP